MCIYVCKALQELEYEVLLASQTFQPSEFERLFGMGDIMENCTQLQIPKFKAVLPRLQSSQRLLYSLRIWPILAGTNVDVAFSTQSSPFFVRSKSTFHFIYDISNLFAYPPDASPLISSNNRLKKPYDAFQQKTREVLWRKRFSPPSWFFATGSKVLGDLRGKGYGNSSLLYPPARTMYGPILPKKRRVIQVARIIPDKRLEMFFDIAKRLPEYEFLLLGRNSLLTQEEFPGYSKSLLETVPDNVVYIESPLRQRPEVLQESKVYLYTGNEPGIVLSIIEAIAAGCVPLSPPRVGAADIIEASKAGYIYENIEAACRIIRTIMKTDYSDETVNEISKKADPFSPEVFERNIQGLVRQ